MEDYNQPTTYSALLHDQLGRSHSPTILCIHLFTKLSLSLRSIYAEVSLIYHAVHLFAELQQALCQCSEEQKQYLKVQVHATIYKKLVAAPILRLNNRLIHPTA